MVATNPHELTKDGRPKQHAAPHARIWSGPRPSAPASTQAQRPVPQMLQHLRLNAYKRDIFKPHQVNQKILFIIYFLVQLLVLLHERYQVERDDRDPRNGQSQLVTLLRSDVTEHSQAPSKTHHEALNIVTCSTFVPLGGHFLFGCCVLAGKHEYGCKVKRREAPGATAHSCSHSPRSPFCFQTERTRANTADNLLVHGRSRATCAHEEDVHDEHGCGADELGVGGSQVIEFNGVSFHPLIFCPRSPPSVAGARAFIPSGTPLGSLVNPVA